MLEKYFYLEHPIRQPTERKEEEINLKVIPKMVLHDNRVVVTRESQELLKHCMPVHSLESFRRKVSISLLPRLDIAMDIALWSRKELRHGEKLLPSSSIN